MRTAVCTENNRICGSFCHGDEENGHRACTNGHLTTTDQSEIRKAYLVSVAKHMKKNP